MLETPEEVKKLFLQDSITKNFRVHFPNGERDDLSSLVNKNVTEGSVQFTESLCSQENLKFGLCEASVLEFETIDVGNIKGCEIEAGIEIDISSLGEEFIAEYGQTSDDVAFPYYYVPYGRFTVDSCKRQSNMRRRQVIAYDALSNKNLDKDLSEIEIASSGEPVSTVGKTVIRVGAGTRVYPGMNYESFFIFNMNHFLRMHAYRSGSSRLATEFGEYAGSFAEPEESTEYSVGIQAATKGIGAVLRAKKYTFSPQTDKITNFGLKSTLALMEYDTKVRSEIKEVCRKHGIVFDDITLLPNPIIVSIKGVNDSEISDSTTGEIIQSTTRYVTPGLMLDYSDFRNIETLELQVPVRLEVFSTSTGDLAVITPLETFTFDSPPEVKLYQYNTDSMLNFEMQSDAKITTYRNLLGSYLEINGLFGKCARDGTCEYVKLQNNFGMFPSEDLYPSENLFPDEASAIVPASTYSSVWYEEFTVKPYGTAVVEYTDTDGKDQAFVYTFDETAPNIYYFKDNFIFKNVQMTEDLIKTLLDTYFIPNIQGISYTPAEIEMVGLPHMEAGDVLNVLTKTDGFETIVFRRTLTGIQKLTDSVEAQGNEVNDDTTG